MNNINNSVKVTLIGEKEVSWAIRTDLQLAKEALKDRVTLVQTGKTDYLHCVWPNEYYEEYIALKKRKRFVAVFQGNPIRLFENSPLFFEFCRTVQCVAQTKEAYEILKNSLLPNVHYIPYISDEKNFFRITDKKNLRDKYNLPQNKFIICNFFRDSLGQDLNKFKPEKGGDIFCVLLHEAEKILGKGKIHVLLTGGRRHAILKQLDIYNIGYTYVGKRIEGDDSKINIQNATVINELYNASDLLLVTSRSEGAPRAILEAATVKLPILSTPVGVAKDLLDDNAIIDGLSDGVNKLIEQVTMRYLDSNVNRVYEKMIRNHSVDSVGTDWNNFYNMLQQKKDCSQSIIATENVLGGCCRRIKRKYRRTVENNKKSKYNSLCIWYNPDKDGNEYVKSIEYILSKNNIQIYKNNSSFAGIHIIITPNIDGLLKQEIEQIKNSKIILFLFFNSFAKNSFCDNLITIGEQIADQVIWQSYLSWDKYRCFMNCNLTFFPMFSLEFNKLKKEELDFQNAIIKMNLKIRKYKYLNVISSKNLPSKYEFILQHKEIKNDNNFSEEMKDRMIYILHKDAYQDPYLLYILSMDIPVIFFESDFNNRFFSVLGLKYSNEEQFKKCMEEANVTYRKYKEITRLPSMNDIGELLLKILFI